ncbi:PP2C family protein-serine/threonine phosphatase [Nocardioides sp.]|uniref:PP2C family protein-serine/threonine phosphatase n=1 Tax=Nocardioides sp. TaxID=35761 RepID=UPI002717B977|nr:PP2C family protein-serine/threonine phosphatase [Nocardioides sp.]MDO9458490.1 PP2C family protein-serine/threonine phosphatase [Nocardioides sp.]
MEGLFSQAGTLARTYADVDWSATGVGSPDTWSPTLRSTVRLMLSSRFPMTLLWGEDYTLLYNEAYVELIRDKHPGALGSAAHDVFDEAWSFIGPLLDAARTERRSTWIEDADVPLARNGFLEECYFTFSYSPVLSSDGVVEGVIDVAAETTTQVVTARRLALLGRLGALLTSVERLEDVPTQSVLLLRAAGPDFRAVDLYPASAAVPHDPALPAEPRSPVHGGDPVVEEHDGGTVVWLPLHPSPSARPLLAVAPSPMLPLDDDFLGFLRLTAAAIGQALDRAESLALERQVAGTERAMSETLQRSLLGEPTVPEGYRVATRYQPAVQTAQVGGDWHDAFALPDGRLVLTVGDVSGHDRHAAAAMAQMRNLLRGIAHASDPDPAAVLTALDGALHGLEVGTFATAVLAVLEPDDRGGSTLTWSNAGHPPPYVVHDGAVTELQSVPELLLGVEPTSRRTTSRVTLARGSTVVLYTDGLVERRDRVLDAGLAWLADELRLHGGREPDDLADHLLAATEHVAEDDTALVCVRVG